MLLNEIISLSALGEDALFAAMAAIGFACISHTPRRTALICGLAGAAAHAFRSLLMAPGVCDMNIIPAGTIAAFLAGVIAVLLSPLVKVPAEACLFPALLPMIPGMYAYKAVAGLAGCLTCASEGAAAHQMYLFFSNALTCTAVVIGMVLGANLPIFMFKKISFQATR